MALNKQLPGYQTEFGDLDYHQGVEARTVYSPAAYLADLLQLLEDHVQGDDLGSRRPDLKDIPLDGKHTFTLLPYLDIVNELLATRLEHLVPEALANETLEKATHPVNLPFAQAHAESLQYLKALEVGPEEIYQQFATEPDAQRVAQLSLGLSDEVMSLILADRSSSDRSEESLTAIKANYRLDANDDLATLEDVSRFMQSASLTRSQLHELLFQNLSDIEKERASEFFIHKDLDGIAVLDEDEGTLLWHDHSEESAPPVPPAWFDRVNRLVRLSRHTGIGLSDLDLILRSCADNQLDEMAISCIASVVHLSKSTDIPIDIVCSLSADINTSGFGTDTDEPPMDPFNRIFNGRHASLEGEYLPGSAYTPVQYSELAQLPFNGDPLATVNVRVLKRLSRALRLRESDIALIDDALHSLATETNADESDSSNTTLGTLSMYHRISIIAHTLEWSVKDLLLMLGVLDQDPWIRRYSNFPVLIASTVDELNCLKILATGSALQRLWLVQLLFSLSGWMQARQFSVIEVSEILTEHQRDELNLIKDRQHAIDGLDGVVQAMVPVFPSVVAFGTSLNNQRLARVLYETLLASTGTLVSAHDSRLLLQASETRLTAMVRQLLHGYRQIDEADLLDLGIHERVREKLYENLIFHDLIDVDGKISALALSGDTSRLSVSRTFDSVAVFDIIAQLQRELASENEGDTQEGVTLLLSDFDSLEISGTAQQELHSNLEFNQIIDEEGGVLDAGYFLDNDNRFQFDVDSGLSDNVQDIIGLLADKQSAFDNAVCRIESSLFSELNLAPVALSDLLENLRFNHYLDPSNAVVNKTEMLALDVHEFSLVLQFYPHRRRILELIQQQIKQSRMSLCTVHRDDLDPIARQITARHLMNTLQQDVLRDRVFIDQNLVDPSTGIVLDSQRLPRYLNEHGRRVVAETIHRLQLESRRFVLHAGDFSATEFMETEVQDLLEILAQGGFVESDGTLSANQHAFFLNIDNALTFQPDGYGDLGKDIFFAVHAVATRMTQAIDELIHAITSLAKNQEEALLAILSDFLEIDAQLSVVICGHVLGTEKNLVEAFVAPLLAATDSNLRLTGLPQDPKFCASLRRIRQFARLASRLGLTATECDSVFRDQGLVDKYAENLAMPASIDSFDFLVSITIDASRFSIEGADALLDVILLYSSDARHYWLYDSFSRAVVADSADLTLLIPTFAIESIDAGFNDTAGNAWLLTSAGQFMQESGQSRWQEKALKLGRQSSRFAGRQKIDAAFVDKDSQVYLFGGDQYLRSSTALADFDEGYPRKIAKNWPLERNVPLPQGFDADFDAAFLDTRGTLHAFKGHAYGTSGHMADARNIADVWGKLRNNFTQNERIDAAMAVGDRVYFFAGDQCLSWSSSIENPAGLADTGSLQLISEMIPELPQQFVNGIDAIFQGFDGRIHVFKGDSVLRLSSEFAVEEQATLSGKNWGNVHNVIAETGEVSAAFSGLDGRAYVFGGTQYIRYSGTSREFVDEGYPKTIAGNWGGLSVVDAAFILDGKTYLVGLDTEQKNAAYVCYSTSDYTRQDVQTTEVADKQWWMTHFNLVDSEFANPDCVFIAADGITYLLKDKQYIAYDDLHRWWSQPAPISSKWTDMPFARVDAAFTGQDGRTWFFSGSMHACYNDSRFSQMDARYPLKTADVWSRVRNQLVDERRVDAALVVAARGGSSLVGDATYLFSGDQYVRYSADHHHHVDEGYPRSIAHEWRNEPCMVNDTEASLERLDAAYADRRHVYLFKDKQCRIISDAPSAHYTLSNGAPIDAVISFGDVMHVKSDRSWRVLQGLESRSGPRLHDTLSIPPELKAIPERIRSTVSAAFVGTDGVQYSFSNQHGLCYNAAMERSYPTGDEWGVIRNHIVDDRRVDAAFVGTDGITYLFRSDQFLSYTPATEAVASFPLADAERIADGLPGSISEKWGGLESVNVAFVRDGKTYLLEHTDEQGRFRYVCYSTPDYSAPDHPPHTADISWWEFPGVYLDEGFDAVDSVLIDDEHLYLFDGDMFIQFNAEERLWTYPRPVDRLWRSLPFGENLSRDGLTAFTSTDGITWIISGERAVAYAKGSNEQPVVDASINEHWIGIRNNITQNHAIDAAVVLPGEVTYLFSGDQFVRYTGTDYRYVDEGYPRLIGSELRLEPAFASLPSGMESEIAGLLDDGGKLSGVIADERHRLLFTSDTCYIISGHLRGNLDIDRLGALQNIIQSESRVDAACVTLQGKTYLFSGDQYVRYSGTAFDVIDTGYPKSVLEHFATEGSGIVFDPMLESVDAAVQLPDSELRVFVGQKIYSSLSATTTTSLQNLTGLSSRTFSDRIDAAFVASDGQAYFFSGNRYIRYSRLGNEFVDEGFPRTIRNNWGNLDSSFETSIDHAFVFDGRTYLVKGDHYVRFDDAGHQNINGFYPQKFRFRWGRWNDYLLTDLKTITEFKVATARRSPDGKSIVTMLDSEVGYVKQPYQLLADVFGWPVGQVKWLKRHNAFLPNQGGSETRYTIELMLRMIDIFQLTARMGVTPQEIFENLFDKDLRMGHLPERSAAYLRQWLAQRTGQKDWEEQSKILRNESNLQRNAALLPCVVSRDESVDSARGLFAQLLIDVEMGGDAETSRVKEAISAIQLYLHRYFTNLETLELKGTALTPDKAMLKHWWAWLRNYRVWEANRKVFLYPENYIQPELRDNKSEAFVSLERTLLQGEISKDRIATAFNDYMNEFSKVGNLRITGANVYADPTAENDQILVLLGHSRTEPRQYYYRTARFTASGRALWESWIPMEINIESSRVFPVFAFGRLLVFWTEVEAYEEAAPVIQTQGSAKTDTSSTSTIETSDTVLSHRASVKFSFYDFNKRWINPQTLTRSIKLEYRIDAMFADGQSLVAFSGLYCLRSTTEDPQGSIKRIAKAYPQIPEPFHTGIDAAVLHGKLLYLFKDDKVVVIGNSGAGEVLADKPIQDIFHPLEKSKSANADIIRVLGWDRTSSTRSTDPVGGFESGVSAAFLLKKQNQVCLIDKQGLPGFFYPSPGSVQEPKHFEEQILKEFEKLLDGTLTGHGSIFLTWLRILTRDLLRMEPVDAVFEDEFEIIYLLRQGQYECYRYAGDNLTLLEPLDGFPKPIKGNLSFNMDKFFDKLHVVQVQDFENDREFVELTYSSPEANTALLTGKVLSDLTFKEGDLRVDFLKSQLVSDKFRLPQPSLLSRADYIKEYREFSDARSVLDRAAESLQPVENRQQQRDDLQAFLELMKDYIEKQDNLERGKSKADDELLKSVDAAWAKSPVLGLEQPELEKIASVLIEQFRDFDKGRSRLEERLETLTGTLSEAHDQLTTEAELIAELKVRTFESLQMQIRDLGERMAVFETFLLWHTDQISHLERWSNHFLADPLVRKYASEGVEEVTELIPGYRQAWLDSDAHRAPVSTPELAEPLDVSAARNILSTVDDNYKTLHEALETLHGKAMKIDEIVKKTGKAVISKVNVLRERYYGKDDVFPDEFGIRTDSNFTFGQPDWHVFEAASGSFLCRPVSRFDELMVSDDTAEFDEGDGQDTGLYEILRLNSTSIPNLSRQLFAGGVDGLLALETQQTEELPEFVPLQKGAPVLLKSNERSIYYRSDHIGKVAVQGSSLVDGRLVANGEWTERDRVPGHESLDFHSANASYYWEIFFHAPFLIAQTLNRAQKFEDAKNWYEYIFDPAIAEPGQHWRFLPFNKGRSAALMTDDSLTAVLNESIDIADLGAEMQVYLNDPFDPHAIAGIRQIAYKKAIVMRSIDNLLDWGDVMFGQYTVESINEARMLYMLAYDLLGEKPDELRRKRVASAQSYDDLLNPSARAVAQTEMGQGTARPDNDLLLGARLTTELDLIDSTVHHSIRSEYFHIPENTLFLEYWTRVEDRLFKIRNSLNIRGLRQELPLFQPPIDPMSIVQSVAGGASLSQISAAGAVPIPHYRFSFVHYKATELVQKLNQFGNELLAAIEKGDAEQLGLMQHKQEGLIIGMTSRIREAQISEARTGLAALESSRAVVAMNQTYNQATVDDDYLDAEIVQLALMSTAVAGHVASAILKVLATFGATTPDALIGPFIMGLKFGGSNLGSSFSSASEAIQTAAEGLSVGGEMLGIVAQHDRLMADTKHQAESAVHELAQIDAQIKGAELQIKIAEYELEVHRKEIEHHDSIGTFMKNKFSNEQLYQWLSGQLSTLYYQSYKMAHDMARSAERAFQFERGKNAGELNYIGSLYWNSQRKGLLAGESLGLDLQRLEQAYFAADARRLEIVKSISLMSLDPLALLRMKALGRCEFELTEALFDYDFQGHYCRQIKTMEVIFDAPDGQTINATLTQLNHRTVMAADPKAVKYLMDFKGVIPENIRSDWRASQQIALSHVDLYEKSNGMFETRLDDDRYLPFEGTGAVSRWQLVIDGKRGSVDMRELLDVTLVLKYTALQGGEVFADAVRSMLKPYDAVHLIDFNFQFHRQWLEFLQSSDGSFEVPVTRDLLPNMAGGRISGLFTSMDTEENADIALRMNDDDALELRHGNFLDTSSLSISPRGSTWKLDVLGQKRQLRNVQLVVGYKASV